ncbi:hypothetical protein PR003_g32520 [Phytophthora rubi]|nr:hypothetical protein PR003_g32520 [Phytophthora rubi]
MTPTGTEDQPPRREFLTVPLGADIMNTTALPGSIVVATNDDTCYYACGWNERFALRSNRKLLELSKGDVVLFRGDFILAPVGYDTNNICLHAYLDSPFYERPHDHAPPWLPRSTIRAELTTQAALCGAAPSRERLCLCVVT